MVRKQRRIVADHYRGRPRGVAPLSAPSPLVGRVGEGGGRIGTARVEERASLGSRSQGLAWPGHEHSLNLAGRARNPVDSSSLLIRLAGLATFKDCTANRSLVEPCQT